MLIIIGAGILVAILASHFYAVGYNTALKDAADSGVIKDEYIHLFKTS